MGRLRSRDRPKRVGGCEIIVLRQHDEVDRNFSIGHRPSLPDVRCARIRVSATRIVPTALDDDDDVARRDRTEAAAVLRRILQEIERGGLTVNRPLARVLVRRLEGAVVALEALEPTRPSRTH